VKLCGSLNRLNRSLMVQMGWGCRRHPQPFGSAEMWLRRRGFLDHLLRARLQYKQMAPVVRNSKWIRGIK